MHDRTIPSRRHNNRDEGKADIIVRPNLETVVRDNLRPMVAGLGGFYIFLAAISAVVHPKAVAVPMVAIATATATLLLGLACLLGRRPVPLRWAHPVTGAISGLVLLNCLTTFYLIREPQQTTNFMPLDRLPRENPVRKDIDEISKAGDRAAALTRQLLAFSRRQVLQRKALNLNGVVGGIEKMPHCLLGEGIELITVLGPALGKVKADSGQIEQVLMNLCVNARDAMEGGGVLIIETANVVLVRDYVQEHTEVRHGPYVMLAVMDTGCGMDDPTMQHMFEPFFTTKDVGKGTGLGLATVHGIVKQHEGHIWVYSEPGKGTTFKIYLPQVDAPEAELPATESVEPIPPGTETILLVEDEAAVRLLAERILREKGYSVLVAPNPETAEQLFARNAGISLLLTDIIMPGGNGRDLYERLAAIQPSLKVLYISGYTDHAILRRGLLNPGTPFLQKPFAPSTLAQEIRNVLDTQDTHACER